MKATGRWQVIAVITALLFTLVSPTHAPATESDAASLSQLRTQLVYFQREGRTTDIALTLNTVAKQSKFEAGLWKPFLASWKTAQKAQVLRYTTPSGLPSKGHVFVVLGASLTSSGKATSRLKNRLKVALKALAAYPNSKVLVTGGVPKNGHTEGAVMRDWLIDNGISAKRIITETKSSSTVGNANYSMAKLASSSKYTSYTLISDASHIRRASVLFNAAALQIQQKSSKSWAIRQLGNVAYKDKTITNPANTATVNVIASNVAMVLGVTTRYKAVLSNPPPFPVLKSLKVAPTKTKFAVGSTLSKSGVKVTAVYDKGSRVVTSGLKVSGFNASKVGKPKVSISYKERSVVKKGSFKVSVVKATTKVKVTRSKAKVVRNRTRVTVKVQLTTATGIRPTGKVRFYIGKTWLKTVTLKASAKGKASYRLPRFLTTGTKKLKVAYVGSSKVTSARKTIKIKVVK